MYVTVRNATVAVFYPTGRHGWELTVTLYYKMSAQLYLQNITSQIIHFTSYYHVV